jgi:hypothetical protein
LTGLASSGRLELSSEITRSISLASVSRGTRPERKWPLYQSTILSVGMSLMRY